jgi:hypothetical protein
MNKKDFDNLIDNIKQAGKIKRGQIKAGRIIKGTESVKRHREWQKTLDKDAFFDKVF